MLVEDILACDLASGSAQVRSTVPRASILYEGHFPGRPLLPGTMQIELMAQTAGVLTLARDGPKRASLLAGVGKARFRREVGPGEVLTSSARMTYDTPRLSVFDCHVEVQGQLCASAEIRLAGGPVQNVELARHMERLMALLETALGARG